MASIAMLGGYSDAHANTLGMANTKTVSRKSCLAPPTARTMTAPWNKQIEEQRRGKVELRSKPSATEELRKPKRDGPISCSKKSSIPPWNKSTNVTHRKRHSYCPQSGEASPMRGGLWRPPPEQISRRQGDGPTARPWERDSPVRSSKAIVDVPRMSPNSATTVTYRGGEENMLHEKGKKYLHHPTNISGGTSVNPVNGYTHTITLQNGDEAPSTESLRIPKRKQEPASWDKDQSPESYGKMIVSPPHHPKEATGGKQISARTVQAHQPIFMKSDPPKRPNTPRDPAPWDKEQTSPRPRSAHQDPTVAPWDRKEVKHKEGVSTSARNIQLWKNAWEPTPANDHTSMQRSRITGNSVLF
eukprot:TRINITY_DN1311_c0_g1_i4.p1 TRINITY_DN1311_c0_g1~~TRINITY_DN1311_c0_g1_i4.p1  ORF type:complete len:358 (+),score=50.24 TRINITY_DN1311_c0_g1_i4:40-1113(+)